MDQGFQAERSLGYQQLTSLATAVTVIPPAGTSLILITPEGAGVRWRDDGTAPTTTVGYPLNVGMELRYTATGMRRLQVVQQAASAVLNLAFYG